MRRMLRGKQLNMQAIYCQHAPAVPRGEKRKTSIAAVDWRGGLVRISYNLHIEEGSFLDFLRRGDVFYEHADAGRA